MKKFFFHKNKALKTKVHRETQSLNVIKNSPTSHSHSLKGERSLFSFGTKKDPSSLPRKIINPDTFWDYQKFPSWKEEKNLPLCAFLIIVFLACSWGLIGYFYKSLPPQMPLYFSKIGNAVLTPKKNLLFLPLGFALATLVNFYLAHLFYRKEKLLSQLYIYLSLFLNILLIILIVNLFYLMGVIF